MKNKISWTKTAVIALSLIVGTIFVGLILKDASWFKVIIVMGFLGFFFLPVEIPSSDRIKRVVVDFSCFTAWSAVIAVMSLGGVILSSVFHGDLKKKVQYVEELKEYKKISDELSELTEAFIYEAEVWRCINK
jgi:hypothetical protein